jgi:carbon-monoxide dehydrogenase large subunit
MKIDAIRPARLVGQALPRPKARQLVAGRGRYLDDVRLAGMLSAAFLRSPHPHARLLSIDTRAAAGSPGVFAVFTARDLARVLKPWTAVMPTLAAHRSVAQSALVAERALWQGQPVALVIAESVALAEDAVALIEADWEPLPPVASAEQALADDAVVLHPELGSNVLFHHSLETPRGGAPAAVDIRRRFRFPRHTGVSLEPRGLIADFDPEQQQLTVHASTQVPHQMRAVLASQLSLPEHQVRVIVPDVGGGFGVKLHCYEDEMAVAAAACLLGRPVKYVVDRLEAFATDIHARAHIVEARVEVAGDGTLLGFEVDDQVEAGAVSVYPRTSALEALHAVTGVAAPYRSMGLAARVRVAFQNKPAIGSYRGVGQPIACAVTEMLIDSAARALQCDPVELRRRNYRSLERDGPRTPGGLEPGGELSFDACTEQLLSLMNYQGLRAQQREARSTGRYLGIGWASFIEQSAPNSRVYGGAGVAIAAGDGCSLRLEANGGLTCITSAQFQGQGLETGLAQLISDGFEIPLESVRIVHGDTAVTPVGGGTWASRGLSISGEAALVAVRDLQRNLLKVAAELLEAPGTDLEFSQGAVRVMGTDRSISLAEIGFVMHYQPHRLEAAGPVDAMVTAHVQPTRPYQIANGVQASLVEVDIDTGLVHLLGHWVVDDCGRVINPLLVDEQLRGGVVQGIGAALFEECRYDDQAQLLTGTLADYLVPMASEMPDIVIGHVETPVQGSLLGAKGVGEASIVGAAAAVANAVNDALSPFGVEVFELPITPERVLRALGAVGPESSQGAR